MSNCFDPVNFTNLSQPESTLYHSGADSLAIRNAQIQAMSTNKPPTSIPSKQVQTPKPTVKGFSGGGLMQLVAHGAQDQYLMSEPKLTMIDYSKQSSANKYAH